MERSKYYIGILLVFFSLQQLHANNKLAVYNAYVSNNMKQWQTTIDNMQKNEKKSNEVTLELINYQYGYIGWCIGNNKPSEAEKYLALAEKNLVTLEKLKYNMPQINAYKAAFYGFKIGLSQYMAPYYGPKSIEFANLAIAKQTQNWLGYVQYANIQYYMPQMFGGSKTEALNYYLKAKDIMEMNSTFVKKNWNYLSLLVLVAQAYTELNNYAKAKAYYEKILLIEPHFVWVKNDLYPSLLQKIKKK